MLSSEYDMTIAVANTQQLLALAHTYKKGCKDLKVEGEQVGEMKESTGMVEKSGDREVSSLLSPITPTGTTSTPEVEQHLGLPCLPSPHPSLPLGSLHVDHTSRLLTGWD